MSENLVWEKSNRQLQQRPEIFDENNFFQTLFNRQQQQKQQQQQQQKPKLIIRSYYTIFRACY